MAPWCAVCQHSPGPGPDLHGPGRAAGRVGAAAAGAGGGPAGRPLARGPRPAGACAPAHRRTGCPGPAAARVRPAHGGALAEAGRRREDAPGALRRPLLPQPLQERPGPHRPGGPHRRPGCRVAETPAPGGGPRHGAAQRGRGHPGPAGLPRRPPEGRQGRSCPRPGGPPAAGDGGQGIGAAAAGDRDTRQPPGPAGCLEQSTLGAAARGGHPRLPGPHAQL